MPGPARADRPIVRSFDTGPLGSALLRRICTKARINQQNGPGRLAAVAAAPRLL